MPHCFSKKVIWMQDSIESVMVSPNFAIVNLQSEEFLTVLKSKSLASKIMARFLYELLDLDCEWIFQIDLDQVLSLNPASWDRFSGKLTNIPKTVQTIVSIRNFSCAGYFARPGLSKLLRCDWFTDEHLEGLKFQDEWCHEFKYFKMWRFCRLYCWLRLQSFNVHYFFFGVFRASVFHFNYLIPTPSCNLVSFDIVGNNDCCLPVQDFRSHKFLTLHFQTEKTLGIYDGSVHAEFDGSDLLETFLAKHWMSQK